MHKPLMVRKSEYVCVCVHYILILYYTNNKYIFVYIIQYKMKHNIIMSFILIFIIRGIIVFFLIIYIYI